LKRLGPPYDFKSWVYRIAGNMAVDGLRRYRREVPLPDWDGGEITGPEPADQRREGAPEDQAGLAEVRAAVWRTIHQLPDSYRQILVLREIDGLSYNEIAAVLDLSLDNVRVTLHRARLQFRDLYELQVMVEEGRMACQALDDLLHAQAGQGPHQDLPRLSEEAARPAGRR
jgi:RNA polymerase sigma-70 factor (ECF subfamily)